MAASPFAFFRGAAAVMAADLAHEDQTGLDVQLCGDAHLVNFGGFASPERDMIFDVNDFDETIPGPFEWDLKRLAASLEVAGRSREFDDADPPVDRGRRRRARYRDGHPGVRRPCGTSTSGTSQLDAADHRCPVGYRGRPQDRSTTFQHRMAKAQSKDHLAALAKLTDRGRRPAPVRGRTRRC